MARLILGLYCRSGGSFGLYNFKILRCASKIRFVAAKQNSSHAPNEVQQEEDKIYQTVCRPMGIKYLMGELIKRRVLSPHLIPLCCTLVRGLGGQTLDRAYSSGDFYPEHAS